MITWQLLIPFEKRSAYYSISAMRCLERTKELSSFPLNDYTDKGQLGHIIIGAQMIRSDPAKENSRFSITLENQLLFHCILAHHGELEYGSPKEAGTCRGSSSELGR